MASITAAVLAATPDPTRPMLTFYDDGTGERTELSALTLGNWAAKTANFLRDELGVEPGDALLVDLPEHWQTAAILLGAWWAGAAVELPGGSGDVVVTTADRLDEYPNAHETIVAPLDPFGMDQPDLPFGVIDYGPSIRIHSDDFVPGADAGLSLGDRSAAQVLDAAQAAATAAGVASGSRVLSTRSWRDADGIVENLVAPLAVGASLIAVANPDEGKLAARAETERATVTLR